MAEDCILIDHGSKGRCSWLVSPGTVIMEKKKDRVIVYAVYIHVCTCRDVLMGRWGEMIKML